MGVVVGVICLTNVNHQQNQVLKIIFGGPRRIRTPDPLIRSQVLYPAELSVHVVRFSPEATALQEPIGAIVHASSNATALR